MRESRARSKETKVSVPVADLALVTLTVARPNKTNTIVQGPSIGFQIAADGSLVILDGSSKPIFAFNPSQWVTVNTPAV